MKGRDVSAEDVWYKEDQLKRKTKTMVDKIAEIEKVAIKDEERRAAKERQEDEDPYSGIQIVSDSLGDDK
jgi:septal ring factor EnvC (AmiA/AmiB activator)